MAKQQFQKLNQPFTAIELDKRDDSAAIQAALGEITGATSVWTKKIYFSKKSKYSIRISKFTLFLIDQFFKVPRVFVNGKFIGGGTDVKNLYQTGELKKLLD